eukprot:CAMPEP_0184323306 /NCGR_PEP_ID=MMETSP1049-20130417/129583_1 /TAXON_ID=77928 /ORGANISM="Proteomonas sulcata, Strain CCMP704" /LENGTH=49 /DNA_ID= /DNA_START= /DNA_END= /DNA_ORIENTATION=
MNGVPTLTRSSLQLEGMDEAVARYRAQPSKNTLAQVSEVLSKESHILDL